ncbi:MAG: 8-oxoguanine glycosylase ogg1 [Peltula sp. TS41687]|nr:MAG: 8-oxoguanine glycosylase ogg1 [Peltula sp. TS41687]
MASGRVTEWRKLPVSLAELCIDTSLRCGQSFRWRKSGDDEWSCALQGRILSLRQDPTHLHYRAIFPSQPKALPTPPPSQSPSLVSSEVEHDADDTAELIRRYFNLEPNLTRLYEQWSTADTNFKAKAPRFTGVRILRQDAWEALVGFICSSNNNIARISQMMLNRFHSAQVEKLCIHYGPLIGYLGSQAYHDMPSPEALTDPKVESHLRQLGFGYRAKYLHQTAITIADCRPKGWLESLRNPESQKPPESLPQGGREGYRSAHEQILELQGVGPKVADCVCLMGLGWGEAVPVDTHVWQIAQRDYKFGRGKHKSLTKATYDAVGDHFRNLWGAEAGWAHSVLFTADLRAFSERLVEKVISRTTDEIVTGVSGVAKLDSETVAEVTVESSSGTKRRRQGTRTLEMAEDRVQTTVRAKRRRVR